MLNTDGFAKRPVQLSTLEFDVLVEHLDLRPPLVLKVPSPGRTYTERAELVDRAWQGLRSRGLGEPSALFAELADLLRLIARPHVEVDGRLWLGHSVRALAAADAEGQRAALAGKDGDTITLGPATPSGLPRAALSVLPETPPGPGRSVSLRSADLDAAASRAGDDVHKLTAELESNGVRRDDAANVTDMVRGLRNQGQFGAAARDRLGHRTRLDRVVGFFDTDRGRYVQLRRDTPSGEAWSTVAPADRRRLIGHLEELLAEAQEPAETVRPNLGPTIPGGP